MVDTIPNHQRNYRPWNRVIARVNRTGTRRRKAAIQAIRDRDVAEAAEVAEDAAVAEAEGAADVEGHRVRPRNPGRPRVHNLEV